MKEKIIGIGYTLLGSLLIVVLLNTNYYTSLLGEAFKLLGFPVYTKGDEGLHLPSFIGLILLLFVVLEARRCLEKAWGITTLKALLMMMVGGALGTLILFVGLNYTKMTAKGLNAIAFVGETSCYSYKRGEHFDATVTLRNYSDTSQTFYMDILLNEEAIKRFDTDVLTAYAVQPSEKYQITVAPQETLAVAVDLQPNLGAQDASKEGSVSVRGGIQAVKLYNEQEQIYLDEDFVRGTAESRASRYLSK